MLQTSSTESSTEGEAAANAASLDLNPSLAIERLDSWLDQGVRLLPNIGVALLVILIAVAAATLARRILVKSFTSRGRSNLGEVLGGSAKLAIVTLGILFGATVVFPSLNPGDLVAGLGIGSVAIGFAFKDILQNWLAGILILVRQPFEIGDQIVVNGYEGTVEEIETRATLIKTYDGQRVVMPNSEIYTNAVRVKTALEKRRSQYDIGIGYGDDLGQACEVILEALRGIEGIESDPPPEVLPWDLAASWVTLRARWWTDTKRTSIVAVRSAVIESLKKALDDAGIDMPYETSVQLFHDQTEDNDGDRSAQREGWPAPGESGTVPRWRAQRRASEGTSERTREKEPSVA